MRKIFSTLLAIIFAVSLFAFGAFNFTASADTNEFTMGYYTYKLIDNKAIITEFDKNIGGKITIPQKLGGFAVTEIENKAFIDCVKISEIIVPDGVTSIGNGAFAACENLEKITLPSGITTINDGTFSDCTQLNTVNIPDTVKTIGDMAFYGCESLGEIVVPKGATTIGAAAFAECKSLKKISIPDSVKSVGESAFSYCTGLNNVEIGSGINTISTQMFYDCKGITDIVIPKNIKTIGNSAFDGCSNLVTIKLSKSVETIKTHAFDNCNKLGNVLYTGNDTHKNGLSIELCNDSLNNANWVYNICESDEHDYDTTTTKATTSKNGKVVTACTVCGNVKSTTTIKYAKTFTLSTTSYTYNGNNKTPTVTVKDSAGTKLKKNVDYTLSVASSRKNVGTYKVTVTLIGNYTGTKTLTFKINPAKLGTVSLSATSYTYDGKTKTPSVTVKNAAGTKLKKNTDYTLSVASSRKNAGTYKVTVKGIGNYTGTKTVSFKINPAKLGSCKLSATTYTYSGKNKTPTVTVKNAAGTKLKKNTDYTISVASNRKNVGTYKVTIKGKGNYTGTKTLTFKINPAKTTVSKLTAGTKSFTVNITKKSTQVTGYQIQYSTSKSFTGAKTKTITSYKTTKATLKSLSAKKTYYVRVRTYKTVSGTKYYSGWSTAKSVKTK